MVDLALNDHFVVTQLTSDAVRLMQLDDMWTARAPIGKIDELNLIVEQMEPLIRQVSEQAARLRDIAVAHTMALDATLIFLMTSPGVLTDVDRADLSWLLRRRQQDSLPEIARAAAKALDDPESEINALRNQLHLAASGETVTGDFSKKFRCGLGLSLISGGFLSLPAAGVATAGVLAIGGAAVGVAAMALTGGIGGVALIVMGLVAVRGYGC